MKTLFFLVFLPLSAFVKTGPPVDNKTIKKNFAKIKPGIHISKYETTNEEYRQFIYHLKSYGKTELWEKCVPDSNSWINQDNGEAYKEYYFQYLPYNQYPVVAVSYEGALEYCKWLTEEYNMLANRKYKKVVFRLPTKEEWIYAANAGDTSKQYTWGSGFVQNKRKQRLCSYLKTETIYDSSEKKYIEVPWLPGSHMPYIPICGPVKAFSPNSFGIYNMCGNAAEMIAEKGIAKGGSYADPVYKVTIASEKSYDRPQPDIGFRVVMEVVEK